VTTYSVLTSVLKVLLVFILSVRRETLNEPFFRRIFICSSLLPPHW